MYSLHRKLKLSKCIKKQKTNEDMVIKLKSKFGNDAVFVTGNYSRSKHLVSRTCGKHRIQKAAGGTWFLVYLIDECRTSQCCTSCENRSLTASREYQIHGHIKGKIILKLFFMVYFGNQIL